MSVAISYGICWDVGDVITVEESERRSADGSLELVELVPGIADLLGLLATRGVAMAIVSDNQVAACEAVLRQHGLDSYFAHRSISEALGVEKPHPAMFRTAAAGLRIPPSRLVMVGNNYYRDIEGASRAGMTTIWFRWNNRYPGPENATAADHVVTSAAELAAAIDSFARQAVPARRRRRPVG